MIPKIKTIKWRVTPAILCPLGDEGIGKWEDILCTIGNVIKLLFEITAAIAVIYIIIAGYKYITAYGNPEKIQSAKVTLTWAILGFIISVSAFLIVQFIISKFVPNPTDVTPPSPTFNPGLYL